ncbi:MAG TPA: CoA transferase [Candidatus Acidoferrales bacterium]|nr:CoA transferase [Candidatus Acidoferrales bacterium]
MSTGILSGIRVIDCGTYIAAPAAATVMSDFGAEVIKIERPPLGDPYRYLSLLKAMPESDLLYCWILDGRNKKSLALDLSRKDGRDALLRLVKTADVFITNYPGPLVRKFQLSYEELRTIQPKLIYAHITGYGDQGEDADKPGYDATAYWARSGLMSIMHNADTEPCTSPAGFGDHPTSMSLFGGIMLALFNRERTGAGTKVSTSLVANGVWSNACMIQAAACGAQFNPRRTRKDATHPIINHYLSRDGKRFLLCCVDGAKDWPAVCKALELDDLCADERFATQEGRFDHRVYLIERFDQAAARYDMTEIARRFLANDVIWGPVPEIGEIHKDAQMEANGIFTTVSHPERGSLRTVNSPLNLLGVEKEVPSPAPEVGQHTLEMLQQLGYSDGEIEAMIVSGAAACAPRRNSASNR